MSRCFDCWPGRGRGAALLPRPWRQGCNRNEKGSGNQGSAQHSTCQPAYWVFPVLNKYWQLFFFQLSSLWHSEPKKDVVFISGTIHLSTCQSCVSVPTQVNVYWLSVHCDITTLSMTQRMYHQLVSKKTEYIKIIVETYSYQTNGWTDTRMDTFNFNT